MVLTAVVESPDKPSPGRRVVFQSNGQTVHGTVETGRMIDCYYAVMGDNGKRYLLMEGEWTYE